jgi:hypothetical protein
MSRLTGTDAYGLMGAYNNVYTHQEITEEQVWEEVETWINSLIEEGYDLSDYTWEEMYESYLEEQGRGTRTGSNPNISQNPIAQAIRGDGPARPLSAADRSRRNARPSSSPTFQNTGGFGRYAPPSAQVKTPTPAATARPATPAARPAAPAPAARPAARPAATSAPAARPAARPAASPAPTATARPASTGPAKPSLASQAAELRQMRAKSLERQGKPLSAATVSATAKPTAFQANSFDPFDVVIGHLLDEGYADTEESALAIMANMSEEWKETILGEGDNYDKNRKRAAQRAAARNEARKQGKTGNVPGVGYVSPRPERETYRDSAGVERHTSGARMPSKDKKDD